MTREEAAKYADNMTYRDAINNLMKAKSIPYRKATFIKVNELLKALEQEPCDTVSRGVFEQVTWERDAAIEQLKELGYSLGEKPKTGHWIDKGSLSCRCDQCGCKNIKESPYCPWCGAYMKEVEK